MSWKQATMAVMADILRFLGRSAILIDVFLISIFSVWLIAELLWHTAQWLDRTLFSGPW